MPPRRLKSAGFSLIELLIVIAVLGILAGLVLPSSSAVVYDQLRAAARILRTDLAYGRSLAVANNSSYRISFDPEQNRYVLEHSGVNPALDALPDSPFRRPGDPPNQQIVDLKQLPHGGANVRLVVAASVGTNLVQRVDSVEFGPLGETTRSEPTVIWLAAGGVSHTRYVTLEVDPVTGLVGIGPYTSSGPPANLLSSADP